MNKRMGGWLALLLAAALLVGALGCSDPLDVPYPPPPPPAAP